MKIQLTLVGAFVALGWLSGCNLLPDPQIDPVRYFTLSKPTMMAPVADAPVVRPIQLAPHLRGRKMAVRVAEHEVIYLDDLNWASPLDDAILAVLRSRLATVGGGATISAQVQRCELVRYQANVVQFSATYTITPASGEAAQARRGVYAAPEQTWNGRSYAELVTLIGRAVDGFADKLAAEAGEK